MVVANGNGRQFGEFANLPGQPSLAMWRADLHRVVHQHAVAAGIAVQHGKRLVDVREDPSGVTAVFSDGSTATADVLVGADGIRSTVRSLIDPDAPDARYVGLLGFGGFAPGAAPAEPEAMHFVYGKEAFFGYWTLPDGRTGWFSNLPHEKPLPMAEARRVPADEWMRQLRARHSEDFPAHDVLRHADADGLMVIGSLEILPKVPQWHRGRMALVGDAAHAPSSSSGQGASLAVESAVQLARCLRDLPDAGTAFAAYERLRRSRVEKIAANAEKNNRQKAFGPVGSALMSVLMPVAMKTFLKPEKVFGPVHNYRIDWDARVNA